MFFMNINTDIIAGLLETVLVIRFRNHSYKYASFSIVMGLIG